MPSSYPLYRLLAAAAVMAAVPAGAGAALAQDFSGKTVRVIVGYAAGGGYDTYGRQVARHIGRHLPGNPTTVVQNMPGAGSITSVNYLYNSAPKDGTEFGIFARAAPLLAFAGDSQQVRFDPLRLTWIGTSSSYEGEAYLMAVRKDTGVTSISDLQRTGQELKFAGTSFGTDGHDVPLILAEVFNINLTSVRGYPGGNSLYLAVERGEMHARMVGLASIKTARPAWLEQDSPVRIILQFARETRLPELADVPTARELARSDEDRALIEMLEVPFFLARPFAGPPDIPVAQTKALRQAFMAAHKNPQFKADAEKLRLDTSPLDGEAVSKLVERLSKIPRPLYERYARILSESNTKSEPRQVNWEVVEGKISKLARQGRFEFEAGGKTMKSRITSGYTKLTVGGKEAKGSAVKEGMACKVWFEGDGTDAGQVECQ